MSHKTTLAQEKDVVIEVNDRHVDTRIILTETFRKKQRGEPSYLYRCLNIPRGKRKKYPVKPRGRNKRVMNVEKM